MSIHAMTRAHRVDIDYGFLGTASERWWRSSLRYVKFEDVAVLLEAEAGAIRLIVSGIPSARRDITDTPIRHTLVLAGRHDADDVTALLPTLVTVGLDAEVRADLGLALDEEFPEDRVVELRTRSEPDPEVDDALWKVLLKWSRGPWVAEVVATHTDGSRRAVNGWRIGPMNAPESINSVFDCVDRALHGEDVSVVTANILPDRAAADLTIGSRKPGVPGVMLLRDGIVTKLEAAGKKAPPVLDQSDGLTSTGLRPGGTIVEPIDKESASTPGSCGGLVRSTDSNPDHMDYRQRALADAASSKRTCPDPDSPVLTPAPSLSDVVEKVRAAGKDAVKLAERVGPFIGDVVNAVGKSPDQPLSTDGSDVEN